MAAFLSVYRNALAAFLSVYRNALAAFLSVYRNALAAFLSVDGRARQPIQFEREDRSEAGQRIEQLLPVGPGTVRHSQSQMPRPVAVGSRSQSGGVSQTNARMAMTHRS